MVSRLAVVTGATRGIGRSITERLTSTGRKVAALGRSKAHLREVADATGALPFVLDVSDPVAVARVFDQILSEFDVPDLLVNNAGVSGGSGMTWELDPATWWEVFETNVRGTYLCTRAVLPAMMRAGSGRIINLSSGAAIYPVGPVNDGVITSAYMASKAAVNRFTEAVAGECFSAGVRVFAMSPGMVKTDMTAAGFPDSWDEPEIWTPVERALDLITDIDAGILDRLSGRYFRAAEDDSRAIAEREAEAIALDAYAQRVQRLP